MQQYHPRRTGKRAAFEAHLELQAMVAEPGETILLVFHGLPSVIRTFDGYGGWSDRFTNG